MIAGWPKDLEKTYTVIYNPIVKAYTKLTLKVTYHIEGNVVR